MMLETAVTDVLGRLGDLATETWSSSEIKLYLRDGYDQFCAKTKCLWDVHVIENIPITGNWQTDLERSIAEQTPGFGLTDRPFHFTGEHERNLSTITGGYGQSYSGPAPATVPGTTWTNPDTGAALPSVVPGGDLPHSTVGVSRVYYDNRTLQGTSSTHLKSLDPNYEKRTGDPQWFTWDKDGIFFLRVVPAATGNAAYDTVSGSWGVLTQRLDADSAVEDTIVSDGGWGFLTFRDDTFPAGGQHGTPTRIHPDTDNIMVEVYRLGRDLATHPFELPSAYLKYVYFWAMAQAFERDGPGQDLELSALYYDRFALGVSRMERKKRDMDVERVGAFGGPGIEDADFALGDATAPFPYGIPF